MTRFSKATLISQDSASVRGATGAKKIIVVGIGKVTQFSIIMSNRDKQSNTQVHKRQAKKRRNRKERANKTARVKWGRGKREANGK